ncbi:hypothetical protein NDI85_10335 [Halomicroarcula sp. S1AR25-4]|uniref:hypothetical protein n=1 Tax=Haloarcula sp. S1AR25-4 TaxID=2950538 RepID=UPI002874AC83|nr:hypothetical protein [Halomicroarcula sp. S1AR25-4]MDS0278193.1 hypothetical protein [Halomicroarcula sp. S1AR25-4]
MVDDSGEAKLYVLAALALSLGVVHVVSGTVTVLAAISVGVLVLGGCQAALGLFLVPAGVGIALRRPWGRWVGVVAFGGIAVVQLLPFLSGTTLAIPVAGVLLSTGCSLYLLLAGEAFQRDDDGRVLTEDTNPHEFRR